MFPSTFDQNLEQAIGDGVIALDTAQQQVRLPTTPVTPSALDISGFPIVRLRAPNGHTGRVDDIAVDGNDEDFESTVLTGLMKTDGYGSVYDRGSGTWSRVRSNEAFTLLPGIVRNTGTFVCPDTVNFCARGAHFGINMTAVPGVVTVTPTIQALDAASGAWYSVLVGTAIVAAGLTILKIYPGIATIANAAASDILPRIFRISMAHSAPGNFTYTVSCNLVL